MKNINKEEAIALYKDGVSITELASKYNVSLGAISHMLKRNNISTDGVRLLKGGRPKKYSNEILYEVLSLYGDGVKAKQLSIKYGIPAGYIRQLWLKRRKDNNTERIKKKKSIPDSVVDMMDEGLSIREIAKELHIAKSEAFKIVEEVNKYRCGSTDSK